MSLVSVVCCRERFLRPTDPSSRGVLQSVACLTKCEVQNLNNEPAYVRVWLLRHNKETCQNNTLNYPAIARETGANISKS